MLISTMEVDFWQMSGVKRSYFGPSTDSLNYFKEYLHGFDGGEIGELMVLRADHTWKDSFLS